MSNDTIYQCEECGFVASRNAAYEKRTCARSDCPWNDCGAIEPHENPRFQRVSDDVAAP